MLLVVAMLVCVKVGVNCRVNVDAYDLALLLGFLSLRSYKEERKKKEHE